MLERFGVSGILVSHFFRRFFDNDTIQSEGDTLTTIVRSLVIVGVPGLVFSFLLQTAYNPPGRGTWAAVQDQYFCILFSFVVMGTVAVFEWEMLFPDRLDFLILSPLPLKDSQVLTAKAIALLGFLGLFLLSCNLCAAMILPAIGGHFLRQLLAHWIATLMAGLFSALLFLSIGGLLLCVLPAAWFRAVSSMVRVVSITLLVALLLNYGSFGDALPALLSHASRASTWVPTLWFIGLYQQLLQGKSAPPMAATMAAYAIRGTAIVSALVLITYPAAWARMRRMAVEGAAQDKRQPHAWLNHLFHRLVLQPEEHAVFHFIGQTIGRNNRYQLYLAMYGGLGMALAITCAVTLRVHEGRLQPVLSNQGLHAVIPLLLFWAIAGLRNTFAFPLNLSAGWIFRITGVSLRECASAARKWVRVCGFILVACICCALRLASWSRHDLLVQIILGLSLATLLTDIFFFEQHVPFNRPRLPGKTNFPLMLTLYIGVFPLFIFQVIRVERLLERSLTRLLLLGIATILIHAGLSWIYASSSADEDAEGYEGEIQILGLNALR